MKCNKIFCLFVVFILVCSMLSVSVFAADEVNTETTATAEEAISEPTTNIYYIIEGMWEYFLPAEVIADNANVIAFYTIALTVIFALAPFIILFKFLFRKK